MAHNKGWPKGRLGHHPHFDWDTILGHGGLVGPAQNFEGTLVGAQGCSGPDLVALQGVHPTWRAPPLAPPLVHPMFEGLPMHPPKRWGVP